MVDAGTVWEDDVGAALLRLPALEECRVLWLEEPFVSGALAAYQKLATRCRTVKLAGGEGCHNVYQARCMLEYGGLGYVQIDAGRIGGISQAKAVADDAGARGVTFVNHTFTTYLALCASIQPYAGMEEHRLCEYPVESSELARGLTRETIGPDQDGQVRLPGGPGIGVTPDPARFPARSTESEFQTAGGPLHPNAAPEFGHCGQTGPVRKQSSRCRLCRARRARLAHSRASPHTVRFRRLHLP